MGARMRAVTWPEEDVVTAGCGESDDPSEDVVDPSEEQIGAAERAWEAYRRECAEQGYPVNEDEGRRLAVRAGLAAGRP